MMLVQPDDAVTKYAPPEEDNPALPPVKPLAPLPLAGAPLADAPQIAPTTPDALPLAPSPAPAPAPAPAPTRTEDTPSASTPVSAPQTSAPSPYDTPDPLAFIPLPQATTQVTGTMTPAPAAPEVLRMAEPTPEPTPAPSAATPDFSPSGPSTAPAAPAPPTASGGAPSGIPGIPDGWVLDTTLDANGNTIQSPGQSGNQTGAVAVQIRSADGTQVRKLSGADAAAVIQYLQTQNTSNEQSVLAKAAADKAAMDEAQRQYNLANYGSEVAPQSSVAQIVQDHNAAGTDPAALADWATQYGATGQPQPTGDPYYRTGGQTVDGNGMPLAADDPRYSPPADAPQTSAAPTPSALPTEPPPITSATPPSPLPTETPGWEGAPSGPMVGGGQTVTPSTPIATPPGWEGNGTPGPVLTAPPSPPSSSPTTDGNGMPTGSGTPFTPPAAPSAPPVNVPPPTQAPLNGMPTAAPALPTLSPTTPNNSLTNSTITPGPATDRYAIAQAKLNSLIHDTLDPQFAADNRDSIRAAAATGTIGSGQLNTSLGDILARRTHDINAAATGFLTDAETGSIDDAYRNIGIAQQQQLFQKSQSDTAFDQQTKLQQIQDSEQGQQFAQMMQATGFNAQQIQQAFENAYKVQQLSDDETGQAFYRALMQFIQGNTGDPAAYLEWLAGQYAQPVKTAA